ncbi:hypothetical protein QKG26_gp092 [Chelonid alphaherpesvirus 5]|uniref:Uncharacterized protein n=1 Tax=Chelonid alphaherpesvirus 5 TaxID=702736 RepID=V5NWT2_9ALPH|nr:hypothetical protein QKG26_gp092 [Chelonid alphaherpesvirus 5]AHA93377.1 hypothetical protein [Chelonid alphaherpesvirus 5]
MALWGALVLISFGFLRTAPANPLLSIRANGNSLHSQLWCNFTLICEVQTSVNETASRRWRYSPPFGNYEIRSEWEDGSLKVSLGKGYRPTFFCEHNLTTNSIANFSSEEYCDSADGQQGTSQIVTPRPLKTSTSGSTFITVGTNHYAPRRNPFRLFAAFSLIVLFINICIVTKCLGRC